MDALATILRSVRLASTLLSRAHLAPPFSIESAGMSQAVFHAVVAGECWIQLPADGRAHALRAGDVAVVGARRRHIIAAPADRAPVPITSLGTTDSASGVPLIQLGAASAATRIICGTIELEHPAGAGVIDRLPALMSLSVADEGRAAWLRSTLELLDSELDGDAPGASAITTRLVDAVVGLAIREATREATGSETTGWVAAAKDPAIGRALALMHEQPERDWTATDLAAEVGLSRTRLFEQFGKLVGEPPARYLVRWRVQCAADLMREPALSLAEIAERVGYSSEDALSRAFKRVLGTTASAYRREQPDAP